MTASTIAPAVLADLVAAVPARLKKRLDGDPNLARAWTWTQSGDATLVATDGGETVTLRGDAIVAMDQLTCTCLLSPRCLHVVAVASLLELADRSLRGVDSQPSAAPAEATAKLVDLTTDQLAAARQLWRVAADTLHAGADAAGAAVQGQWLRAIHEGRAVGLHRPAQDAMTALRQLRALRSGDAAFSASALCAAWLALLSAAHCARSGRLSAVALGEARQSYAPASPGAVRLHGLFCEPLWLRGLGGCATWLCDDLGQVWCLRDVRPTDANNDAVKRAHQVAEAGIGWGGATVSHRQLSRGGLFVQGFAASASGRLGGERAVQAATAAGTPWTAAPIAQLFERPLADQLQRAWQMPPERESDTLVFVCAAVVAADGEGLILARAGQPWQLRARLTPGGAASALRDKLLQLAKTAGVEHWWIGRWSPERPAGIDPLAVGGPALQLPAEWAGRACLGYDRLQGAMLPAATAQLVRASSAAHASPLSPVQRWCEQLALGGAAVARRNAGAGLHRDAERLRVAGMATAATVVEGLAGAARGGADDIAGAWLAAGVYLGAARRVVANRGLVALPSA